MEQPPAAELAAQFRAISDYIETDDDPAEALHRLVQLAARSVTGCEWAAVTRVKKPATLAASDDTARAIDAVQIDAGEGPCLTAGVDDVLVHVTDLAVEARWPRFTATALANTPLRSALSFALGQEPAPTALNLYADHADAFTDESLATAALFASHARVAVMHLNAATRSANLERALTTSRQIGAAIGILMAVHKVTADQAFELLRASSQQLHRKLSDIADEVTETGVLP